MRTIDWSPNLAYIVGLIATDGNLSNDGRHISLTSKDYDQIQNFVHILRIKNKVGKKGSGFVKGKTYYFIQFGNVKLYRFLESIGIHPNKTKIIDELLIPDQFFADFLRGHLDGDGFTYSYWDKRWKSSFMLYTGFVSASKNHLIWMEKRIYALYDIQGRIKHNGKSIYQLIYAKRSSITLLRHMYHAKTIICLERKRFKIEVALGIINGKPQC